MRYLLFTVGAPGCGKSTWIKNNGLEEYTISPDNLRFLFGSIETKIDGRNAMTLKNDNEVWKLVFDLIERRMKTGDLIVIDATHSSNRMISAYKNLIDRYRYRAIAIDFRNINLETILSQNKMRSEEQHVSDSEIKRICERLKTFEIPNWVNVYDYKNNLDNIMKDFIKIYDYANHPEEIEQINVIGDVHGCSEELKELLKKNEVNFNDSKTVNIWVGDYFDRAPTDENLFETFELLNNLDPKRNIFLTGNHENYFAYLKEYERLIKDKKTLEELIKSSESKIKDTEERLKEDLEEREIKQLSKKLEGLKSKLQKTRKKLVNIELNYDVYIRKNIPRGTRKVLHLLTEKFGHGEVRKFFRKLLGYTHFKFNSSEYFICHGGFPRIPKVKDKMIDIIRGVGKYGDEEEVIKYWSKNTNENQYLIFGHRDIYGIKNSLWNEYRGCIINGDAESDPNGTLKCFILRKDEAKSTELVEVKTKQETFQTDYLSNKIFKYLDEDMKFLNEKGIIFTAQRHKFIDVKKVKDSEDFEIYAINFSNKAFRRGIWDALSIHARGLFVLRNKKTKEEKIISRGYHKFFNTNERPETKIKNLRDIKYPLEAYEKANGYLGLLSTFKNPETNEIEFFITSKTSVEGDFAKVFQKLIKPELNDDIKNYLYDNNVTAVFEVIEPEFDPHIQKYNKPELVFLNLIKNEIDFKLALDKEDEFMNFFKDSKLIRKVKKLREIESYKDLIEYLNELNSHDLFDENFIEGAVIREKGESPFMFKVKTEWYKFWKSNRTTKDNLYKKLQIPYNEKETQKEKEIVLKTQLSRFKNYGGYEYQKFLNFLLHKIKKEEPINLDIISLRAEFINNL